MDACVDRRIATVCRVNFADDSQPRLEVDKSARWQWRTASRKLQERLALISTHSNQYIYEPLEARTTNNNNDQLTDSTFYTPLDTE